MGRAMRKPAPTLQRKPPRDTPSSTVPKSLKVTRRIMSLANRGIEYSTVPTAMN